MSSTVQELRLVLTVKDYERVKAYYRDLLGSAAQEAWEAPDGKIVIFNAGRATLEIIDEAQAERIDAIEVGRRVSGSVRIALAFGDVHAAALRGRQHGGSLVRPPVRTPWQSLNARVIDPEGWHVTLFENGPATPG